MHNLCSNRQWPYLAITYTKDVLAMKCQVTRSTLYLSSKTACGRTLLIVLFLDVSNSRLGTSGYHCLQFVYLGFLFISVTL